MDNLFGIILFSWIVIAPTVGFIVISNMDRRRHRAAASDARYDYSTATVRNERGTMADT